MTEHTVEKDAPTEACHIVNVEGSPVRVQGKVDGWDAADHAAFAEVIAAARAMRGERS